MLAIGECILKVTLVDRW